MSKAYTELRAAARDVGWPLRFETDLTTHDRGYLAREEPPAVFGWILYHSGTFIVDPRWPDKKQRAYVEHVRVDYPGALCFWWDGSKLHSLSLDHFAVMVRQTADELRRKAAADHCRLYNRY